VGHGASSVSYITYMLYNEICIVNRILQGEAPVRELSGDGAFSVEQRALGKRGAD
jgi:hypothetical protein